MPKKRWVRCNVCEHIFASGGSNPTCSQCRNRNTTEIPEDELKAAIQSGEIEGTKELKKKLFGSSAASSDPTVDKRHISAKHGVSLDPRTQQLYDWYVETYGKISLSDFINKVVQQDFRSQGIEPAMVIGDVSGKQVTYPIGQTPAKPLNTIEQMDKAMAELRLQKIQKMQMREMENMAKEDEIELEKKMLELRLKAEGKLPNNQTPTNAAGLPDMDLMFAQEIKRAQYEDLMEERRLKREKMELELERKKAEIEKIRSRDTVEKGKFGQDPYSMGMPGPDGQWMPPWMWMMQQQNKKESATPEQLQIMLQAELAKMRQADDLDKLRREALERERRYQEMIAKLHDDKQNMVLNEMLRRVNDVEYQAQGRDRLSLLKEVQQDFPGWFSGMKQQFDPVEREMQMREKVMEKGMEVTDKVLDGVGKGRERWGNVAEKFIDASLKANEGGQRYENFSNEDMEDMYKRVAKGDEEPFYGRRAEERMPQPIQGRDILPDSYDPEEFYVEPAPQPQPAPPPQVVHNPPATQPETAAKKKRDPYIVAGMTGSDTAF